MDRAIELYGAAHLMILPKKHHITQMIIADVHNRCRHARVNHVLGQVRNRYRVIDGRQEVKNWDKGCKSCERRRAQPAVQKIAPLSKSRLGTTMRAFSKCCVDYAGPFTTKITRGVSSKRYLCLFTCSATRAVHLEMACSLSTTDFLNALSRIVATRERPDEITSNNGTDFVRADKELRELVLAMDQQQIANNAASDRIRWNWNTPLGSRFRGVSESLVKVAKETLKEMLEMRS